MPVKKKRGGRHLTSEEAKRMSELGRATGKLGKHGPRNLTILKQQAYLNIQERLIERSNRLVNAQTMLGLGTIKVYRIDAHYETFGKQRKLVKEKPKLVKDDEEIISVLDHEYADGPDPSSQEDGDELKPRFYFVETQDANNSAIDSQLNRLFGKAKESLDITTAGEKITPTIVGMQIVDNSKTLLPDSNEQRVIDIPSPNEPYKSTN